MLLKSLRQFKKNKEVFGIGVDVVKKERIKKLIKNRFFIERIFSKKEIKNSSKIKNKCKYFSNRFAAKEALVKSLGTGFRYNINFKDISVINNKLGKPQIKITDNIKKIIFSRFKVKKISIFLSLSDEKNYSIAFVIAQKN